MSVSRMKMPPPMKPMVAVNQGVWSSCPAISIPGASNDQKLAAIITPAANPSMPSSSFGLISRCRNTTAAPTAVTPQVNRVAKKASKIGLNCSIDATMPTSTPRIAPRAADGAPPANDGLISGSSWACPDN